MPKKIVYIGNMTQAWKGVPTTIETLSKQLQREGIQIITASHYRNKAKRLLHMLLVVLRNSRSTKYVLIDTYSTQNFWYAVTIGNVCRLLHIPYIPILHGGNLPQRLQKNPSQSKKLFHGAKTNVAPSHYLLEAFQKEGYSNVTFISNTIEIDQYPFKQRNEVLPKLLWVRSFAKIYHPMLALKVLERLQGLFPVASLCMVGPDKDGSLAQCQAYATQKNLNVTFTGKLSKKEWIDRSQDYDIFINTTNFDNTPVSVMEAMALGLPVISTNVGGIPYLLKHKTDALCVPPNDVEVFVEAIITLYQTPEMARNIARHARKKVMAFDWSVVKDHWLHLLQD